MTRLISLTLLSSSFQYNKPAEMVLCTLTCESNDKYSYEQIAEGLGSGVDLKTGTPKALIAASGMLPDPNK
jgi:hypothetical protein